jgi:hypothetical protein
MKFVLPSIAVVSLLAAVGLLAGCFVRLELQTQAALKNHPEWEIDVLLDGGRVRLRTFVSFRPAANSWLDFRCDPPRVRMPDTKRLLWEFGFKNIAPLKATEIDFPAWIPLLLCSVAPVAWIRGKRRNPGRGFAVLNPGEV